ncbi:hypothetical protein DSECCO2_659160 [anaerobic digester metagenome]
MTTTTGASIDKKSRKDRWAALPIMMLGGSPIKVAVPPMLEARISVIKKGTGFTLSIWQMVMVMGPTRRTVVTLSRKADKTAVTTIKAIIMRQGSPLAIFAALMAMYSKRPDSFTTATKSIMPNNTPKVPKSMASMPSSKEMIPERIRIMPPARATAALCIFSLTNTAMTKTNTAMAKS